MIILAFCGLLSQPPFHYYWLLCDYYYYLVLARTLSTAFAINYVGVRVHTHSRLSLIIIYNNCQGVLNWNFTAKHAVTSTVNKGNLFVRSSVLYISLLPVAVKYTVPINQSVSGRVCMSVIYQYCWSIARQSIAAALNWWSVYFCFFFEGFTQARSLMTRFTTNSADGTRSLKILLLTCIMMAQAGKAYIYTYVHYCIRHAHKFNY